MKFCKRFLFLTFLILLLTPVFFVGLGVVNKQKLNSSIESANKFRRQFTKTIVMGESTERMLLKNNLKVNPNLPTLNRAKIFFEPSAWVQTGSFELNVYRMPEIVGCKQSIQTYDFKNNLKSFVIECPGLKPSKEPSQTIVISNGFGSSILYNGFPLTRDLLKNRKDPIKIYLLDLPFQSFNNLQKSANQISGDSLLKVRQHYKFYRKGFQSFFDNTALKDKNTYIICLSSSCTSILQTALTAITSKKLNLKQVIMVGPYTGLTHSDSQLQRFGHHFISPLINFGASGKLQNTPFADPFALSFVTDTRSRLQLLNTANVLSGEPPLELSEFELLGKTEAYLLSAQIDNPPLSWTSSAKEAYHELIKFLLLYNGPKVPITIYLGTEDKVVNISEVVRLDGILRRRGFKGKLKRVAGPHNLFTGTHLYKLLESQAEIR
jgi:hypothetical protein